LTTSGTASINFDVIDLVEEAFERCGIEARTGYDFRTARRSLNLLLMEWANRGLNMWTIEQGTQLLVAGTASYTLAADTIDLLDVAIRTGSGSTQEDITINRISQSQYLQMPAKNSTGQPVQFSVSRATAAPVVTFWPVPDTAATYTAVYYRLRRIQDASSGANTIDVPFRFLPALTAGLAYMLSQKRAPEKIEILKMDYEETFQRASEEDRERASFFVYPYVSRA
jgi:hypothetical protein